MAVWFHPHKSSFPPRYPRGWRPNPLSSLQGISYTVKHHVWTDIASIIVLAFVAVDFRISPIDHNRAQTFDMRIVLLNLVSIFSLLYYY